MSKKNKDKSKTSFVFVIVVILICLILFCVERYTYKIIKDTYDIKVSAKYADLPKDELIKDYETYKSFIKKNLSKKDYNDEIDKDKINEEDFKAHDYLALYYSSKTCSDNENYPRSMLQLEAKVVISVTRYEKSECNLETRVAFIPVEKDKYDSLPNVVIKKEIIKK